MTGSQSPARKLTAFGVIAAMAIMSLPSPAAAQYIWTGAFTTEWNFGLNWSPSGGNFPNTATATATFAGQGLGTINISPSVQAQALTFSNPTGNYTLTSSAGQTLSSVTEIIVAAGVTGVETINLANMGTGSLLFPTSSFLTIANNSTAGGTTLVIGPNTVIGTPGSGLVTLSGAGTTQISGSLASSVNGLYFNGPGTLILSNLANHYVGGTFVNGGTLLLGVGSAIPTGTNVTVAAGAQFNTGGHGNGSTAAIGTLQLDGGTFLVPSGSSDYHLNQLTMTGGTVDFSGTAAFYLHLREIGINYAAITTIGNSTTANWFGSTNSHIQNDTGSPLTITVNQGTAPSGIDLDAGIALANGSMCKGFVKIGSGTMRLTNTGNTADFIIQHGALRVDNVAALGSGTVTIGGAGAVLQYGGTTASSTKSINLGTGMTGTIQVLNDGANLMLNGVISGAGQLAVVGTFLNGTSSRLTVGDINPYTGSTTVDGNGVLAIPHISYGGFPSSIGTSSNAAENLVLGSTGFRGTLLFTGTNASYSTDRDVTLIGAYPAGGAIGVESADAYLSWRGRLTGTGNLIKTGDGTLILSNTASTYFAGTFIEAGTLRVDLPGAVIPANRDVTVFSGGTFQIGPYSDNYGVPIGAVTLNGGALSVSYYETSRYYLNKLVMTGGMVDFSQTDVSGFKLHFTGNGAAITTNATSTTATWIGGGVSAFENSTGSPLPINVGAGSTANGIDLDAGISLSIFGNNPAFIKTGAGTMRLTSLFNHADFIVQQGTLRVDDLTNGVGPLGTGALTLNAGRLAYGGSDATLSKPFTVDTAGGTIDIISAATTLAVTSPVTSNGVVTKSGPGVLVLNNLANQYEGGITVSGGRLDVSDDAQLGLANPTVNALGTLRYTADNSTARTFNLLNGTLEVPTGVTLTLSGASVGGGYLRGGGTVALTGGAVLAGVTVFSSTNLNVTGPASATNFTNNGAMTVASGQAFSMNYATNSAAGRITVNGTANVSDFVSYGLINVPVGGLIHNTGSASPIVFGGGSTTFVGSIANPGGKIDLGGQQLIVRGGLLVTNSGSFGSGNGVRNGTTVADYGALVKGTGPYQAVLTQNGGQYLPGNSPGTSQVGDFFINGGGNLIFEITDAGPSASFPSAPGVAGANPGWGLTQVFTSLNFTATPSNKFNIDMRTQLAPPAPPNSPGLMSSFDPTRAYSWKVFDLQPGAVFNGTFDANAINFITNQFANPTTGGMFSLSRTGGQIFLTFTPVPEPAVIQGICAAAAGISIGLRRRMRQTSLRAP